MIYWDAQYAPDHSHAKPGIPTPTNNGWYRLYSSGWVEQGGTVTQTSSTKQTVSFPVEMTDANYPILTNVMDDHLTNYVFCVKPTDRTATSFKSQIWGSYQGGVATKNYQFVWRVSGYAA